MFKRLGLAVALTVAAVGVGGSFAIAPAAQSQTPAAKTDPGRVAINKSLLGHWTGTLTVKAPKPAAPAAFDMTVVSPSANGMELLYTSTLGGQRGAIVWVTADTAGNGTTRTWAVSGVLTKTTTVTSKQTAPDASGNWSFTTTGFAKAADGADVENQTDFSMTKGTLRAVGKSRPKGSKGDFVVTQEISLTKAP